MKLSCVACRQKKIKCDRESPCSHCEKSGTACIPQTRAKTIRKAKKTDESLLQRLKQLESIVSKLENGSNKEDLPLNIVTPTTKSSNPPPASIPQINTPYSDSGRLVHGNGRTTYVPTGFWMTLTNQIAQHLSDVLGEDEDSETFSDDDTATPDSQYDKDKEAASTGFVLGFTSDSMTLRLLHPSAEHIKGMWRLFMENCKPVIKTVYVPTGTERVRRAMTDLTSLSHVEEAWMFCIYYLVALSAQPEESLEIFELDRPTALDRFRWASEQSLARAGFLLTQDLLLLEAFQIYCIALSRHIDNYTVRAMISLLVNVAHSMGLHRDGEQFGLPPFDVEWRRKLWWGVRTIDLRSSLDYDAQSLLTGRWCDTKFPTNLRDDDIWPGMTQAPKPRTEPTEMSSTLMRWELTNAMIEIGKIAQGTVEQQLEAVQPLNKQLDELQARIAEKYLKDVLWEDFVSQTAGWISMRLFKMLLARLWLIVNSVIINKDMKSGVNSALRQEAFDKASTALVISDEIEQAVRQLKWGWLFKRMVDWQSIWIVLFELCHKFEGVDEIWNVIDRAFQRWPGTGHNLAPGLEKPLRRLYQRARAARHQALQKTSNVPRDSLSAEETQTARNTQTTATIDSQDTDSSFALAPELQYGTSPAQLDTLNFEDFMADDLPSLDQFDMFETTINYSDVPTEWNIWTAGNDKPWALS